MQRIWRTLEDIPTGVYYLAVFSSVAAAATCFATGRRETGIFVGHWAPTFALLGLMNRVLRPTRNP
jgi:hypothetical protein